MVKKMSMDKNSKTMGMKSKMKTKTLSRTRKVALKTMFQLIQRSLEVLQSNQVHLKCHLHHQTIQICGRSLAERMMLERCSSPCMLLKRSLKFTIHPLRFKKSLFQRTCLRVTKRKRNALRRHKLNIQSKREDQ